MLGVGASKKTYMDDVFSTYVYRGNSTARSINNGLDLSNKGGMVWLKRRTGEVENWETFDTVRGAGNFVRPDATDANLLDTNRLSAFNSNGFSLGTAAQVNNAEDHASWTFRKAPGFFDVVTYTGNGTSGRNIAHSLGSVPGCIMVKNLDNIRNWAVYHASVGNGKYLNLNLESDASTNTDRWNDTTPTSSVFTVGNNADTNGDGIDYVAYVFAGGESTNDGARSVYFDGYNEWFKIDNSNNTLGTSNFTIECWIQPDNMGQHRTIFDMRSGTSASDGFGLFVTTDHTVYGYIQGNMFVGNGQLKLTKGSWNHVAVVRDASDSIKLYVNGIQSGDTYTSNPDFNNSNGNLVVGGNAAGGQLYQGRISNLRVNKGQALYTSAFRPPTEPLTTTSQGSTASNVEVLCCQNSSATGVASGTNAVTSSNGTPLAKIDSPFDDPAGFKFGDAGDQNVIKCSSYVGNGSTAGPEVYLGWEPQWILLKNASEDSTNWRLYDTIRGIITGGNDNEFKVDTNNAEFDGEERLEVTSNGFIIKTSGNNWNASNSTYVYIAIRRPDGYVGKPAEAGTDVFAMDTGNASSTIPSFDSGFPVDLGIYKDPASSGNAWWLSGRLIEGKEVQTNSNIAEATFTADVFDSNTGWGAHSNFTSNYQSWMWKRHAGMDVVTYTGNGKAGRQIPHSLNATAQMLWIKRRSGVNAWATGHIGLNGGTNPWNYYVGINETSAETDDDGMFADTAPTSTHFTTGAHNQVNAAGETYVAMLFASIPGISKVGYYTGDNSTDGSKVITTGFQPRFILIKSSSNSGENWNVLDSTRGMSTGSSDKRLILNTGDAQTTADIVDISSTGFAFRAASGDFNANNYKYIYYAHA